MESDSSSLAAASQEVDAGSSLYDSLDEESSTEEPVVSLLSRLKAPCPSDFARKRKVATNPPKGKRPCLVYSCRTKGRYSVSEGERICGGAPLCFSRQTSLQCLPGGVESKMSIVRNHRLFHEQQDNSLQDYIESSLMLQ